MASFKKADSRRLYSWWWDSHISPKNSKWLQDNLSDMDMKIKSMIKLIEEDADSFARRAEMYYKKRPELMRLVEEFYRAYRALAERYDHATGALRQAHRTIAEAFPNQIPTFSDEFSPASSATDAEYTFGSGDSPMDPYGNSPQFSGGKGNDMYSDDGDSWADRKGSKQTGGVFTSQDGNFFSNASEKKIKKSLNFFDDGVETTQLKSLQEKISQLSSENESLKLEVNLKSEKSSNLENQVKELQEAHSKLDSQKEEAILQFQECLRRVVELEAQIEVFRKVNTDLLAKVERLNRNEEMCQLLEKENQYLNMKVNTLIKEASNLQEDHLHKKEEIEKLKSLLYHEQSRTAEAESAVKNLEQSQIQSQLELKSSRLEVQHGSQLLKEMESMKKTLEENISQLKEENSSLCIELKQKRDEMNKLNNALQNECKRSVEIEAKFQSLENLHSQSQKELKHLILDLQSSMHDLKEVDMRKQFLVEELSKIKEDIQSLNERNTSLMIMIESLQVKILCLIDVQEQLKNKVAFQSDEKNTLQRDVNSMKEEINNLHLRHRTMADQIQAVGFNEESFQESVTSLQNVNLELKETCKRHESEKLLLFERLAHMDKISENNTALETSLSDTTVELQGLREKMVMVQQSHNSLQDANTSLFAEKNDLILKVENIEGHVEELTKKNLLLECSLSDANAELEGLRGELKNMEESYQSLYADKCSLDVERNTLLSKVEGMGLNLENLNKRYEVLHDEHLALEKEKDMTRRQLIDLQDSFNQEKQDHENFKECSNAKLAILESQISKLNDSNLCKEEQFRNEQHKLFGLEVERFILQRCISDLINGNLSLQDKCQELEQDNINQKEKNMMLSSANGRLVMEMQMILKALTKEGCNHTHGEESQLQVILGHIRELQNSVLAAKNEHLGLIIESSINDILFREIAYSTAELESNNKTLEQMCRLRTDELLGLQAEKCNLLISNNHLEQNLEASYQTEKMTREKAESLGKQLLASKEAEFMLHDHNGRLAQEISSLSSQLCGLGKEKGILEEGINAVLQENVALDCLSVMLKQCNIETSLKLEALLDDFRCTNDTRNHLVGKVKELNETIQVIEDENSELKSLLLKIEEFKCHTVLLAVESCIAKYINNELNSQKHQMNRQIESTEKLLTQKEETLLEVCMILQKLQKVEEKLLCSLKDTKLELDNANCTKDSLEKKINVLSEAIISKDNDIARSLEANATLVLELAKLQKENEKLKINSSNLHKDINCCEDDVTAMLNEFQIAFVHADVYEDKLLELMGDYEDVAVHNMVLRRAVDNEVALRDEHIEKLNREVYELKGQNSTMKAELDNYLPVIGSLQKSLSDLESFIISSQKDDIKGFKLDSSYDQHPTNFGDKTKGIFEMEKLQKKVESIREVLGHYMDRHVVHSLDPTDKGQYMDQYVVHSLDPTGKKYGDQTKAQEEKLIKPAYATSDMIEQVDKTEESEDGLQYSQVSSSKDDLVMKDIELDHASSPPRFERGASSYKIVGNNITQTDDQMLELWKTDEWDYHSNSGKAPEGSWNYTRDGGEGGRNVHPSSELVVEKELGVDKLAMPRRNKENRQDWNKVLERLSSDAQRLTTLETGVLELKNKVETSVKMHPKNYEYDDIRGQLQEAEENILQLLDTNKKLIEKAEVSSSNFVESEPMNQRWRQVSGRARRGSEKIGRLELELQKLQYIFLKLKELDNQKTRDADRRSSVLLRDYLYGSSQGRRKNLSLCCFKPKTKGR